jgi:hypothetical protein
MPRRRHGLNWLLAGATALSVPFAALPAAAAEITASRLPEDPTALILIEGPIEDWDDQRFAEAAEPYLGTPAMVILQSQGGSVAAALGIGEQIHAAYFATIVLDGHECRAACALIWLAGVQRHMTGTSTITLAPDVGAGEGEEDTSAVSADLLDGYLRDLGLSEATIRYVIETPVSDEHPITPEIARVIGLPVWLYRDGQVIPPTEEPVEMRW